MNRTSILALVVFIVLAGLILSLRLPAAQRVQAAVIHLVRPLHTTTTGVERSLGAFGNGLKSLEQLERENEALTVENAKLRATNGLMADTAAENNSLREALGFKKRSNYNLLPARIVSRQSSTWWNTVQIDRGEQDGLDSDMPVVTDVGLVGKTTTVASNTAYVMLVTDENCKVAAKIEGLREPGILAGERTTTTLQPDLLLGFLPKTTQLKPGLKVFSSGVSGGVFPSDLFLGTVKDSEVRALDARATVIPGVDLSKLENVFVVLGNRSSTTAPEVRATPTPTPTGGFRR